MFRVLTRSVFGVGVVLCALLGCCAQTAFAEEASKPDVATILSNLLDVGPADLLSKIAGMKAEAAALESASERLLEEADRIELARRAISTTLAALEGFAGTGVTAIAMVPPKNPDVQPALGPNFMTHIFPIVEKRCLRCHRDDKREGGLSLATFAQAMDGGSSGELVLPGDPDGSRMLRLVMKIEEPYMPPKGKPLKDEQIASIREWIASGARMDAQTKVTLAKKSEAVGRREVFIAAKIGDGPPPMPRVALASALPARPRALPVRTLAASPTAPLVAVGGDRQVILYEMEGMSLVGVLLYPEGDVYALTFSRNGELLLAAGGQEGDAASAVVWNIRTGERVGSYGRGYDTVLAADISPDHGMVALGGPDRRVTVYETSTGEELYRIGKHTDWVYSVKFSPDGELLASADRAGNLFLWQAANGRFVEALGGHNGAIYDLAYTYDSNVLASGGDDGRLFFWDTWKYRLIRKFQAHAGAAVLSLDFNGANQIVSSGSDGQTKMWDLQGKNLSAFEALGDWVYQARFAKDGHLVLAGDWSGRISVWDSGSRERVSVLSTNPTPAETNRVIVADAQPGS